MTILPPPHCSPGLYRVRLPLMVSRTTTSGSPPRLDRLTTLYRPDGAGGWYGGCGCGGPDGRGDGLSRFGAGT